MKPYRILVISDLHFEFRSQYRPAELVTQFDNTVDMVIIAGDIYSGFHKESFDAIARHFQNSIICFVPGNHDFWDQDLHGINWQYDALEQEYLHLKILRNDVYHIPGRNIKILGTTLWFRKTEEIDELGPFSLPDFKFIGGFEDVYNENYQATSFLRQEADQNSIVVTHFIPTYRSMHPAFKNSLLNEYFICPVDDIITTNKPKIWVHGHTHACFDYQYDQTRIIANPWGYPREYYNKFEPNKIIEI